MIAETITAIARERPRERVRIAILAFLVLILSIVLFLLSRGKWSDPIIDSGREWIVPDALARGETLYRDVVYWFGPFTPYFHAAFFRLFGSSFGTLVAAGAVASIAALGALYAVLRRLTGRREAALWTALAVPALVFMPNAGGPILGMGYRIWHAATFALAAIALVTRWYADRVLLRDAGVGFLCALSGLCRTEWGVVTLLAVFLALRLTSRSGGRFLRDAAATAVVYTLVFGGTIGAFCLFAGTNAVLTDGHVLLTALPAETREFALAFSGLRDWRSGSAEMFYSTAMWLGAFLLVRTLIGRRCEPAALRRSFPAMAALLIVLAVSAALGGAGGAVVFSGAPLICLAGLVVGIRRGHGSSAAALAACGLAGLLLSYRRPFHITDSGYVGPPLLFAFGCAAALVHRTLASQRAAEARQRLRSAFEGVLAALVLASFAARAARYVTDPRVPIPGTSGMLSARPSVAKELEDLAGLLRAKTSAAGQVVVVPEGEVLNYLSGRPNRVRHKLYIPGYLTDENEERILEELQRSPPEAIVVWWRPSGEYGRAEFGVDYGSRIWKWIQESYVPAAPRRTRNRAGALVFLRPGETSRRSS